MHDWPLALCDARSVSHNYDTIAADIVERQWVSENMRLYYNSKHRWYYYEGLCDDEVILFRQSDSTIEGGGGESLSRRYLGKANEGNRGTTYGLS